jgi:hypothetical protein
MPPITAWHWIPCPENVTWTCRIPRNAVPYSLVRLAPASAAGPAQGDRPGTPDDIAAAAGWARVTVTAYGRQENRHVAEVTCAWYGSWHTRTVRLILSRDERTASGYDLALITTDLAASPVALVARYAAPWASSRRSPRPATSWRWRSPQPRPAHRPVRLLVHTMIVIWYARNGHGHGHGPGRCRRPPRRPVLVPDQDRVGLRGHAHQAAPHDDRRPVFATPPWSARTGQIRVVLAAWDAATA